MQGDNKNLKQYLLGTLSERENEELDLRLISNESFAEELLLAEHELIEDHLEGTLSGDEAALFASNFLTSPERRVLLREVSLLKDFVKKKPVLAERVEPLADASARRMGFLDYYFRPLLAAAAILIAVLAISLVWNAYFRETRSPLELEYAELNKRDLGDLTKLGDYYPINLSTANFRDGEADPKQNAHKLTDTVLFRLALPANTVDNAVFKATVRRNRTPDFTLNDVRAYRNPSGHELRLLVPKAVLQKGEYQMMLESRTDGSAATYAFVVE